LRCVRSEIAVANLEILGGSFEIAVGYIIKQKANFLKVAF